MQTSEGVVIAVAHSKGGVGKTSLAFNLAHSLADAGLDVAVADLDAQMGQSAFLGGAEPTTIVHDIGLAIAGQCSLEQAVVPTTYPRLSVLPASEASIGSLAARLTSPIGRERLASVLASARARWDVTIVDTPGHLSPAVRSVLAACDGVLVPMPPEAGPVTELPTILNAVAEIASSDPFGRPEVFGVIRVRVWGNSVYRRVAEDQIRQIAQEFGVPLFRNKVPEDARFGEAHLVGMPVAAYEPRARSAVAYRYVALELMERRGWTRHAEDDR